ncbi:MAG: SpoVR family protein, partial [Alphaproteobacteria bacterium]|nr:SpoVR family protein [Alphaproteobacteria bacterium]
GEFRQSHSGVTYQPPGTAMRPNPYTGEEEEVFVGSDINIYALGFAIFEDLKRICNDPTEEDLRWFPHFAGKGNWEEMALHVMESNTDETLIEQYLSPTVMRKFKYFLLEGEPKEEFLTVSAIHADDGFKRVREQLAADYRMSDKIPKISIKDYQEETDRCLVLQHDVIDDQPLDPKTTQQILEMIHAQTKHPVVIESVDADGEVVDYHSSPVDYDHEPHRRTSLHYDLAR